MVFSTKHRKPLLTPTIRKEIFMHIFKNGKKNGLEMDYVNGYYDHCHCLFQLPPIITLSLAAQYLKGESSNWINQTQLTEEYFVGRFNTPEQYENIIIRAKPGGEILKLKDIATVELGSEFFDIYSNMDGHPSAAIVLKQTYGSNASEVIENVKAKLEELKVSFPEGMDYEISYDVSSFLDASIEKVVHTLGEAFILVALVVFIFLGDWRSTLIKRWKAWACWRAALPTTSTICWSPCWGRRRWP